LDIPPVGLRISGEEASDDNNGWEFIWHWFGRNGEENTEVVRRLRMDGRGRWDEMVRDAHRLYIKTPEMPV